MASGIKGPVRNVITRTYAAQAATVTKQPNYTLPHHQPEVSKLSNGAVIASLENNSPISRIGIFVKSGARYENMNNNGVSHILRLCAGLATKNFTAFGITRKTQQLGGTLICQSGREHFSYEMSFLRDNIEEGFEILADVATNPTFKEWEVSSLRSRLLTELGARTPSLIALDKLHSAAFRNTGLGNSLFVPQHRIGKVTLDQLQEFFSGTHTSSRLAIVGLGIEHQDLVKLVQKATFASGDGLAGTGSYGGGEIREETGDSFAYVTLAGSGARIGTDEAAAFAVAQFILGSSVGTKYGSNASSKLVSWIASAGGSGTASAINANYTDGGLFGFILKEDSQKAGDVVKAIAKGIRTLKVTDSDVQNGKARAKAALLMNVESADRELEEMGLQALFTGSYFSPNDLAAAIDKVSAASVQSVMSSSAKGKLSMSAVGGIGNVPYIDQL